jgi:HK97 family phage major capsid protein
MNALTKEFTDAVEAQFSKLNADVQDALEKAGVANGIVLELEQKLNRRGGADDEGAGESWGSQFVKHMGELEGVAQASAHGRRSAFGIDLKATLTTGDTSAGPLGVAPARDSLYAMPRRRMRVRDLLPTVGISTGSVEYPQQTTRTNNAAMVAEAGTKPESAYAFSMETATAKVIAHWVPASRQILEDAPQLRGVIDGELRYGLELKEESQLLTGDGTGENLPGLITLATAYAAPFDPAGTETMIDTLALAILQNALADEPADGIVLHPSDWMRMRLLKDADGKYLLGDPASNVPPVLFGLPVVATQAMTVDNFLVGNFQRAATLYDRWTPRVEVATEHADFFIRNMVAILAEERIALAVKNSAALTYGDFGNVA